MVPAVPAVPMVSGMLPPLPAPHLAVVLTLERAQVGDVTLVLEAGALPPTASPQPLLDALLASESPVALFVEPQVPAATLVTLLSSLPKERARVLVMQTSQGEQGAAPLASRAGRAAPQLRIAPDGFHLARQVGGEEYDLGPDPAGDAFDYAELRGKAKSDRTTSPEIAGIAVMVEPGVTVEVLARAISELRGPMCAVEPDRCWLPEVAVGHQVEAPTGPGSKRTVELSKPAGGSGAPGTVKIGKATAGEGVDTSEVDALMKRRIGFARMCYFAALADSPKLEGTVDLRLTLGKDGKVIEVGIPRSSLADDAVEACLSRGLAGLRFAAPKSAPVAVDVSLTLKLK